MAMAVRSETSHAAEPRTGCPVCGQPIHPIAGKCKHCKSDLVKLRRQHHAQHQQQLQQVAAPSPLPWPPQARAAAPRVVPSPAPGLQVAPPAVPAPVALPAFAADEPAIAAPSRWSKIWPIAVAVIAAIAIVVCVVLLVSGGKSAAAGHDGEKIPPPPAADHMNTDPLSQADPWGGAPPPGAPSAGAAPAPPAPAPAPPPPAPPGHTGTPKGEEFMSAMYESLCKRLTSCGPNADDLKAACDQMLSMVKNVDAVTRDRLAAGECTYHTSRAARCLEAIQQVPCAQAQGGAMDLSVLSTMAEGMTDCASALECTP
jgi:hypothetical protein